VTPGNLQVHWPEAEGLIDRRRRSPQAGIPDYNAVVTLEKLADGDGPPHPSDEAPPEGS
jgi:hypothetical protein